MNTRNTRTLLPIVLLLTAGALAACGAAHSPAAGQAEAGDRFVARHVAVQPAGELGEVLVQATRLPAVATTGDLGEIVVTASRLPSTDAAGNHDLGEIVVSASRLPAAADTQIAALLD